MFNHLSFDQLVEQHLRAKGQLDALNKNTFYSQVLKDSLHKAYTDHNEKLLKAINQRLERIPIMTLIELADGKISFYIN